MTTIEFNCSACGKQIKAPERFAGRQTKCPHCEAVLQIPGEARRDEEPARDAQPTAPVPAASTPARRASSRRAPAKSAPRGNPSVALGAAIGAAALGAAIWAGIVLVTNYEVGWVAWGIGGMVGGACAGLGGRGQNLAVTCAGLALAAILVGKLAATHFAIEGFLDSYRTEMESAATEENYAEFRTAWTAYAELPEAATEEQIEEFMLDHDYDGTVVEFREQGAPQLESMAQRDPSFDEWRRIVVDETIEQFEAEISLMDIVTSELNAIDLLFAFFGVSTAFGLVMGATRKDAEAVRAMARSERRESSPEDLQQ